MTNQSGRYNPENRNEEASINTSGKRRRKISATGAKSGNIASAAGSINRKSTRDPEGFTPSTNLHNETPGNSSPILDPQEVPVVTLDSVVGINKDAMRLSDDNGFVGVDANNKYSRDSAGKHYTKQVDKKRRRRKILAITLGTIAGLLCAAFIAAVIYISSLNSQIGADIDNMAALNAELTNKVPNEPFYVLLMGTDKRHKGEADRSDSILLARIDPLNKKALLLSIPRDTPVQIAGYGQQKINAAHSLDGGAAGVVKAVKQFTGVDIAHYVEVDFNGFKDLVDTLGGVTVNVPSEINDYEAGTKSGTPSGEQRGHLDAGTQTLNGEQALIFCRTRKYYAIGDYQRQANQRVFLKAVASKILHSDPATILKSRIVAMSFCGSFKYERDG